MSKRAFIYCRISNDKTGAGLGVQRQEEDCRKLAEEKGLVIERVFTDNDVSAYSGKPRPGYSAMLKQIETGSIDAVICWHPDRLHRRPVELEAYIDASRAGKVLTYSVKAGEMDLSTDAGQLVARMLGAAARYESDQKATRIRRSTEQKIRAGGWTGGTRPFGWTLDERVPELHPAESEALASAFHKILDGASLGRVIREFNEAGLSTTHGKPWGYAQLRQALLRPRNAGLADLHGEIVGNSQFPPIVSESIWRAVVAILKDPSRRRSQSNRAVHLLAGIARCRCGAYVRSATVTGRNGEKHPVYRCPERGPGHVGKRIEYVDAVVNAAAVAVRAALDKQRRGQPEVCPESEALAREATALRMRMADAAVQAAEGKIPMTMLGAVTDRIQDKLDEVEMRMVRLEAAPELRVPSELPSVPEDAPHAREWAAMHIDDRRDYLRSYCNVLLLPHGTGSRRVFDPRTVKVVWGTPGKRVESLSSAAIRAESVTAGIPAEAGTFITSQIGGELRTYRIRDDLGAYSGVNELMERLELVDVRHEP